MNSQDSTSKNLSRKILYLVVCIPLLLLTFFDGDLANAQARAVNPIVWKSEFASLASSNFYIRIGSDYYYGNESVTVKSDPGDRFTTLEMTWRENELPMRAYLYFRKTTDNFWEMHDIRTYNGTNPGDWIYYTAEDEQGNKVSGLVGESYFTNTRRFIPVNNRDAEVFCKDCSISAFMTRSSKVSPEGFALDIVTGLQSNQTITLIANSKTGYGVNSILRDGLGQLITDQSGLNYVWKSKNESIAIVQPDNIEYAEGGCAYGIQKPCPYMNGQISGISPGVTTILVSVQRNGTDIASGEFYVKVLSNSVRPTATPSPITAIPSPSSPNTYTNPPSPSPSPISNPESEKLMQELEALKGKVGEIEVEVANQSKDINALQRIVLSIRRFIQRFFN